MWTRTHDESESLEALIEPNAFNIVKDNVIDSSLIGLTLQVDTVDDGSDYPDDMGLYCNTFDNNIMTNIVDEDITLGSNMVGTVPEYSLFQNNVATGNIVYSPDDNTIEDVTIFNNNSWE